MNRTLVATLILSFVSLHPAAAAPASKGDPGWQVLQAYVQKNSDRTYNVLLTKMFSKVQDQENEALLRELANEISRAAGHGDYNHPISIAVFRRNPNMVNALTLPGGQIVFLTGILKVLRTRAEQMAGRQNELNTRLGEAAAAHHYRRLVAAVLGHEMGHFFGQHFMRQYAFRAKHLNNTKMESLVESVRYGQEHELESDEFSMRLMLKLGYDPAYLVEVLQVLKQERDRYVRRGVLKGNPYLESHPTGNERLAAVATKAQGRDFFERMAGLERAFASVETGTDLDRAAAALDAEVRRYPKNTHLLTAAAKVYHRRWEASCSLDALMFKSALAPMTFRDDFLPQKGLLSSGAGPEAIPGDEKLYRQAVAYYTRAVQTQADGMTASGFAALLSYDPARRRDALVIAENALETIPKNQKVLKLMALNNAGIVYYHAKDYHSAEISFKGSAGFLLGKRSFRSAMYVRAQKKRLRVLQGFSGRNTGRLYEGFFNLGQLYHRTGYPKQAKSIWSRYIKQLDWKSEWAQYAAAQVDIDLKSIRPGPVPKLAGVGPGASIPTIVRALGKPGEERTFMNYTRWLYPERGLEIYLLQGFAKRMRIRTTGSGQTSNGAFVGMTAAEATRRFGEPKATRGSQAYYPRSYMVLGFAQGRVSEIILFK